MLIFAVMLPIWWQQKVQPINNQTRTNFMLRSATVLPLLLLNCKESQHFQVISIDIRLHQSQTYGNIHMLLRDAFKKKLLRRRHWSIQGGGGQKKSPFFSSSNRGHILIGEGSKTFCHMSHVQFWVSVSSQFLTDFWWRKQDCLIILY